MRVMPKDFLGLGLFALNRGRVSNPQWFTYTQILVDYLPPPFSRGQIRSLNVRVSYSHNFFYWPFLKFSMTTLLQLGVNIIFLDILNSASRILQCWPYYVKINYSTRHRKSSKQTGFVAIDSRFALFGARQYGVTTRESSDEKYLRTLI